MNPSFRPGTLLALGLALACTPLPQAHAEDTCARVSVFDGASRKQKLYPAVLIEVDGSTPGPSTSDSFRLTPGKHSLKVAEAIDSRQFIAAQNRDRDGRSKHDRYKTLEIDAQPGVTYHLAARFIPEHRNDVRSGAYWEPVIWKESRVPCG